VRAVAISPDGTWLAAGGGDEGTLAAAGGYDGPAAARGGFYGMVLTWDARTGDELFRIAGHMDHVTGVAISRDGTWLATGSYDGTVRIWDQAGTGLAMMRLAAGLRACAWGPAERLVLAGDAGLYQFVFRPAER
jgi:WD40 repeat protein